MTWGPGTVSEQKYAKSSKSLSGIISHGINSKSQVQE